MPICPTRMDGDGRGLVYHEQLVVLKYSMDLQEKGKKEVITPRG